MMKQKLINLVLVATLVVSFPLTAFSHSASIPVGGDRPYKSVKIPFEVENNANSDFSDIRLKDKSGDDVPYFIYTQIPENRRNEISYEMIQENTFLKDGKQYFDFVLEELPEKDILASSIMFSTNNKDFVKKTVLWGSYDGLAWEKIQEETLYNVESNSRLEIEFSELEKYTYYRVELEDGGNPIELSWGTLFYKENKIENQFFLEQVPVKYTIQTINKNTVITLENIKNLQLDSLIIESDSMFYREIYLPSGSSYNIHHLQVGDDTFSQTTVPLHVESTGEENLKLVIENNDDKPIKIDNITLNVFTSYLVFEGVEDEEYTLHFTGDASTTSPIYDIVNYKDKILAEKHDILEIETIQYGEDPVDTVPEEKDYTKFFNGAVIVITIILGIIVLSNLKQNSKKKE